MRSIERRSLPSPSTNPFARRPAAFSRHAASDTNPRARKAGSTFLAQIRKLGLPVHGNQISDSNLGLLLGTGSPLDAIVLGMKLDAAGDELPDLVDGFDQMKTPSLQALSKKISTTADRTARAQLY